MTLLFSQDHRVTAKLELVQSFSCRLHEAARAFMMVMFTGKVTLKKPYRYGECGLFEQLLFLFWGLFCNDRDCVVPAIPGVERKGFFLFIPAS